MRVYLSPLETLHVSTSFFSGNKQTFALRARVGCGVWVSVSRGGGGARVPCRSEGIFQTLSSHTRLFSVCSSLRVCVLSSRVCPLVAHDFWRDSSVYL